MLHERKYELSAPATVHIELTSSCNLRCRHCYNYWRPDGMPVVRLDRDKLDRIIDELAEGGVFHVILTGGEPLTNFSQLLHAVDRLTRLGLSLSMNSNLSVANQSMMKELKSAGLGHVLSSLLSHDPATQDFISGINNSWVRMVKGIEATLAASLEVTNNMVISQTNKKHIYKTGAFVKSLGAKGLCGTRVSPPTYADLDMQKELQVPPKDACLIVDELIRVKEDFGLAINSLLPFPLCFLRDFEKYADFAGRRCAGGTYTLSINSNGDAHACQKEDLIVGNILEEGLSRVWAKMRPWRTEEVVPQSCRDCPALPECGSGCRTVGLGYSGSLDGKDNLTIGPLDRADVTVTEEMWRHVEAGVMQFVSGLRFRQEKGLTLLNIAGAKNILIDDKLAGLVKEKSASGEPFTLIEVGQKHRRSIGHLLKRGAIRVIEGGTEEKNSGYRPA